MSRLLAIWLVVTFLLTGVASALIKGIEMVSWMRYGLIAIIFIIIGFVIYDPLEKKLG